MIGKTIKSILTGNSGLIALVPAAKIFPYVMNADTDLPAIVYTIDSVDPNYTKYGWVNDEWHFSVNSFNRDYNTLQPIVKAIRTALEQNKTGAGTEDIDKITLTSMDEGYDNSADVYYNKLTFKVKINTY